MWWIPPFNKFNCRIITSGSFTYKFFPPDRPNSPHHFKRKCDKQHTVSDDYTCPLNKNLCPRSKVAALRSLKPTLRCVLFSPDTILECLRILWILENVDSYIKIQISIFSWETRSSNKQHLEKGHRCLVLLYPYSTLFPALWVCNPWFMAGDNPQADNIWPFKLMILCQELSRFGANRSPYL